MVKKEKRTTRFEDALSEAVDSFAKRHGKLVPPGLVTGIVPFDKATGGFEPGDLAVIVSPSGHGKSALALQMAVEIAQDGHPVLFFTLEQTVPVFVRRVIGQAAGIPGHHLAIPQLKEEEYDLLWRTLDDIGKLPLLLDDTGRLTPLAIKRKVLAIREDKERLDALFIDYLQLLRENDTLEGGVADMGALSRELKTLAKELSLPIVLVVQLDRRVAKGEKYHPDMADLPGNGALEHAADIVLFVQRDKIKKCPPHDEVTLSLLKNRKGSLGIWKMVFRRRQMAFYEYAGIK